MKNAIKTILFPIKNKINKLYYSREAMQVIWINALSIHNNEQSHITAIHLALLQEY